MMQEGSSVSIVIPVHNGEKYIREALDSCFDQTFQNFEVVVVDDASTDLTVSILGDYAKRYHNFKYICVEKQDGLGNVINIGIRNSSGMYIARMDADDVMYPTRLERQVEFLDSHSDCVAVGGQIDIIDADSKITGHREYALDDAKIKRNMFLFQPFAHPAVMLRRSAVEAVGLYPEHMWKVEDVKFFFLLSQRGMFANLVGTVLKYRMTFDTQSQSKMVEHFKKTNEVRNWAMRELHIKPDLFIWLIWKLEFIGVSIMSIFPPRVFMWVFEFTRRLLR